MCLEKPGPRCSGHTRTNLRKAQTALVEATADLKQKKQAVEVAQSAEARINLRASENAHALAVEELVTAEANYKISKEKRAVAMTAYHEARDEYNASPEGIKKNQTRSVDKNLTVEQRDLARKTAVEGNETRNRQKEAYAFKKALEEAQPKSPKRDTSKLEVKPPTKLDDYQRKHHMAPLQDEDNAPLHNLTDLIGDDYLRSPQHYTARKNDSELFRQIKKATGNPNAKIKIYRALPVGHNHINGGDWVALSRDYAQSHLNSVSGGDSVNTYHIIASEVPASSLWCEGNDLAEWGYDGDQIITQ